MYLIFIQDYTYNNLKFYKKDESHFINNEMFARYLIRKRIAVEVS